MALEDDSCISNYGTLLVTVYYGYDWVKGRDSYPMTGDSWIRQHYGVERDDLVCFYGNAL